MSRKRSRSPVEKPNFKPSGILGKYEKRRNGEVQLYSEPLDSHLPTFHWQLFHFQGDSSSTINLYSQNSYQIGRNPLSDIEINESTISKQHAVIQFRMRRKESSPYLIDLNSKYGTKLNGQIIEQARFIELKHKDLLTFGRCEDEFILIKGEKLTEEMLNPL